MKASFSLKIYAVSKIAISQCKWFVCLYDRLVKILATDEPTYWLCHRIPT